MRIGVDLGGTKIEAVALDDTGSELAKQRVATPRGNYPGTLDAIAELVSALEQQTGQSGTVGVGMPGSFSTVTGVVRNANSTWLIGQPSSGQRADRGQQRKRYLIGSSRQRKSVKGKNMVRTGIE